jgi:hypothetical protein
MPDQGTKLSPESSLKKLIFLIGPWTLEDKLIAEDFVARFLKAKHIIGKYLPKSAKLIQNLAGHFPDNIWAIDVINLSDIAKEEQELLTNLGKQLYNLVEVRYYVRNEPLWGQCQGNAMWHTRIPK